MDKREFRPHAAHVRSVRITVIYINWYNDTKHKAKVRHTFGHSKSNGYQYWKKNTIRSASCHWTAGQLYEPEIGMYTLWHTVFVTPVFVRTKKGWGKEGWGIAKLTMESKPHGIDKGQVTLNQIQPLHETPLWSPNEIDLHSEGNDVIPNEQRARCDCSEKSEK